MSRARQPISPVETIATELDRAVAERIAAARASGDPLQRPACRRGCSFCCYQLVPLTVLEAQRIASNLATRTRSERRDLGQAIDRQEKRFAAWVQEYHPSNIQDRQTNLSYLKQRIPCPFLGAEDECRVYAVRPLICRGHHALGTSANCQTGEVPIRVVPAIERATSAAMERARDLAAVIGGPTIGGLISTYAPLFRAALTQASQ
ncbi:MAG TPA: YkgJ family cysteine cluster protein [Chloroflexota bacterium]|nr:YkgJ family cysteine cluster protein [Chloroflexota bacterium]